MSKREDAQKKKKKYMKAFRIKYPCGKLKMVKYGADGSPEYFSMKCGRRSCPRCRPSYAMRNGEAFGKVCGNDVTHLVLTVSDEWIDQFPDELDFIWSKEFTRINQARRMEGKAPLEVKDFDASRRDRIFEGFYRPPEILSSVRSRINRSAERVANSVRAIRKAISGMGYSCKGYIRSIEFGEEKGRYHVHLIIPLSWSTLQLTEIKTKARVPVALFRNIKDVSDKGHEQYTADIDAWKYGKVRITPCESGAGAILYVASYATKNAPGRVTTSRDVSDFKAECKKEYLKTVYGGEVIKDKKNGTRYVKETGEVIAWAYRPAEFHEKKLQVDIDEVNEKLYNKLNEKSKNRNKKRKSNGNDKREFKRAIDRGSRIINEYEKRYGAAD